MSSKKSPPWLAPEMAAYVAERAPRPDPVLTALAERTRAETGGAAGMQVSAFQGAVLTLLTRLVGAGRALELGTFTGYSSICIARGLVEGGSLLCCDVSEDYTAIAREAWAQAQVDDRIELRIAPALDTLEALAAEPAAAPFDLVFIDADKSTYQAYVDAVAPLMRPGALLLVDNTLWSGRVLEPAAADDRTTAVFQAFNDRLAADERFESVILPISDGMTMAIRR
jgi:caffeoyl-CoA O-methyltransferase